MKTKEELKVLKEEVETLNKKLAELSDEELVEVSGGGKPSAESIAEGFVKTCLGILNRMELYPSEEFVRSLIANGGSTLRNWALKQSGGNKMAYLLPVL